MLSAFDVSAHVILSLVLGSRGPCIDEASTGEVTCQRSHQKTPDQLFLSVQAAMANIRLGV